MNSFWKGTIINIAVIVVIALLAATSDPREASGVFGLVAILISAFEFFIGVFLLIFQQSRKYGQIMLAASGIVFLIGVSVCSVGTSNINIH